MLKDKLRKQLRQNCSDAELQQWFDPLILKLSEKEHSLKVIFPHAFFAQWFAKNLQSLFEEQAHRIIGSGMSLRYHTAIGRAPIPGNGNGNGAKLIDYPFGAQYTFGTFITNNNNQFPVASAKETAKHNGATYNPFIICGPHGCGKTHLLRAIANELSKYILKDQIFVGSVDDLRALYLDRFDNDAFAARRYFQRLEAFFLDDFQDIERQHKLQEELVSLFNTLHDQGKQMAFACTGLVTGYDFLPSKLKSRLEWGLIVQIKEPDLEVRVKFIQQQCKAKNVRLSKEQILTLAHRYQDFRYLQGVMLKLCAFRDVMRKDLSDRDFDLVLLHTEEQNSPPLEPETIIKIVADHFRISVHHLTGVKRHQQIVRARQIAMFLCRDILGCSYPVLGRLFGGKDHSTAMHAVKKIKQLQKDEEETHLLVTELRRKCLSQTQ